MIRTLKSGILTNIELINGIYCKYLMTVETSIKTVFQGWDYTILETIHVFQDIEGRLLKMYQLDDELFRMEDWEIKYLHQWRHWNEHKRRGGRKNRKRRRWSRFYRDTKAWQESDLPF